MYTHPLSQLIRIKGTALEGIYGNESLFEVNKILELKGFEIIENSKDGLIITYEHPDYSKDGVNTWLTININEIVSEVKYTKINFEI